MHLLVVEDDPALARVLVQLLGQERHVVELARTGREGLEVAEDGRAWTRSSWTSGCRTYPASRSRGGSARAGHPSRS